MRKRWIFAAVLTIALSAICLTLLPMEATAEDISSGTCGENLIWTLDESGVLTISGTGAMDNYKQFGSPWDSVSSKITSVVIEEGVTSIGSSAFSGSVNLTQITIPESVTTFGDYALSGCHSFTDVYLTNLAAWCSMDFEGTQNNPLSQAQRLYVNGELVTDLVVPSGVSCIGKYAFAGLDGLLSVTIPEDVTSIDTYAFYYCTNLSQVTILNGLTSIGDYAFSDCSGLTSVSIPGSVTSIGDAAFMGCNLRGVYISDLSAWCAIDLKGSIVSGAMLYLDNVPVVDLVIPEGVVNIGDYAFADCSGINSVTIPDSVTSIGISAFDGCVALTNVTIPSSVTVIGSSAFSNCHGLTAITIPDSVTSIGAAAFSGCIGLTSVTIPDSVTSIGAYAFSTCTNLAKIALPDSIKRIPAFMFSGCTNLALVVIPDSVNVIERDVFSDCYNLWHVLYAGTQKQWNKISIQTSVGGSGAILGSATRHYNCTGDENIDAVYKNATCIEDGERLLTCALCGTTESEVIPKHDMHYYGKWVELDGELHKTSCPVCNTEETSNHIWDRGKITKMASCNADGEMTYTCYDCFATKTEAIPAIAHNYGDWEQADAETHKRICSVCNTEETSNHIWNHGTVAMEPTCTEDGVKNFACTTCGTTKMEPIVAKGHNYTSRVTKPTCTEEGYTTYTCACGDTYQDNAVNAVGHQYGADRICAACGQEDEVKVDTTPDESIPASSNIQSNTMPTETDNSDTKLPDEGNNSTTLIVMVVAIVAVGGSVALILLSKKKK